MVKLSGEDGIQGGMDGIVLGNAGINDKNFNAYPDTNLNWVHLKVNYDRVGSSVNMFLLMVCLLRRTQ